MPDSLSLSLTLCSPPLCLSLWPGPCAGFLRLSRLLLLLAAKVHARDGKGSTALMIAALRGHDATVKALLTHGGLGFRVMGFRVDG